LNHLLLRPGSLPSPPLSFLYRGPATRWQRLSNGIRLAAAKILNLPFALYVHTTVTKETKNTHSQE
jgi:hypothetical protein